MINILQAIVVLLFTYAMWWLISYALCYVFCYGLKEGFKISWGADLLDYKPYDGTKQGLLISFLWYPLMPVILAPISIICLIGVVITVMPYRFYKWYASLPDNKSMKQ